MSRLCAMLMLLLAFCGQSLALVWAPTAMAGNEVHRVSQVQPPAEPHCHGMSAESAPSPMSHDCCDDDGLCAALCGAGAGAVPTVAVAAPAELPPAVWAASPPSAADARPLASPLRPPIPFAS